MRWAKVGKVEKCQHADVRTITVVVMFVSHTKNMLQEAIVENGTLFACWGSAHRPNSSFPQVSGRYQLGTSYPIQYSCMSLSCVQYVSMME